MILDVDNLDFEITTGKQVGDRLTFNYKFLGVSGSVLEPPETFISTLLASLTGIMSRKNYFFKNESDIGKFKAQFIDRIRNCKTSHNER
jgi:hypothetical protein